MTNLQLPSVTIYTDGGCNPNPGPGGWAAILLKEGESPRELSGAEPKTTNNQMELRAAIEALRALDEPHQIEFYTDSQYLRQGITEWLSKWEKNGWRRGKSELKNRELWQSLAAETKRHRINWHWTKGHAGNKWNERADKLASAQIPRPELPLDDRNAVHIFAAGSYSGKTKIGGWAVVLRYRDAQKTLSGHEKNTSANRMHLRAAIEGLRAITRPMPIHLYTPSDYLKDGATRWVKGWRANNWQTKTGKPVSHRDLWETLFDLTQRYQIRWHVVGKNAMPPEMEQAKRLSQAAGSRE